MEISKRPLTKICMRRLTLGILRLLLICSLVFTSFGPLLSLQPAQAADNPLVKVRIETPQKTIWSGTVEVKECTIKDSNGVEHTVHAPKATCALGAASEKGRFTCSFSDSGWGLYLTAVDGVTSDFDNFWLYRVNNVSPPVGLGDYELSAGDELLISFGPWPDRPLKVAISKSSTVSDKSFTITSSYYDDTTKTFLPVGSATVHIGDKVLLTDEQGMLTTSLDQPGSYPVYAEKDGYVRSDKVQIEVAKVSSPKVEVEVSITNLDQVVWQGKVQVDGTQFTDTTGNPHSVDHPTALGALVEASKSGGFPLEIASSSYGFYVTSINSITAQGWDGWSYSVNGQSPQVGMGDFSVTEGDRIAIYYSLWPWKLEADKSTAKVGEQVTFTARHYDSSTRQWQVAPGTTVKIADVEYQSDEAGVVRKAFDKPGDYEACLMLGGWPNSPVIKVNVQQGPAEKPALSKDDLKQAAQKALEYLKAQQTDDGSVENAGVSAWSAIAFASAGIYPDTVKKRQSLTDFLITYTPTGPNLASDYARQILAAIACGRDPRAFGSDLITGLKGLYQRNQIGDVNYINDDVFAVLALLAAGEDVNSKMIDDSIRYIVSHQNTDGGFGYGITGLSDVDTTSAVIQTLVLARNKGYAGTSDIPMALKQAKDFLKNAQNEDGGFPYNVEGAFTDSDSASTAWAIQALIALGEDVSVWKVEDGSTPYHFLLSLQNQDGSFSWKKGDPGQAIMTAYAIPALESRAWPIALASKSELAVDQSTQVRQATSSSGSGTAQQNQDNKSSSMLGYTGYDFMWLFLGLALSISGIRLRRFDVQ